MARKETVLKLHIGESFEAILYCIITPSLSPPLQQNTTDIESSDNQDKSCVGGVLGRFVLPSLNG